MTLRLFFTADGALTEFAYWRYSISVEQIETAIIVIDGAETILKAAEKLSAALKKYQTVICKAESFTGTDLLPAHAFFIGCETPEPASFAYLYEMLQHINLSGRPCGVFSTDKKALKYLSKMIEASGANAGEALLIDDPATMPSAVKNWVKTIPASGF